MTISEAYEIYRQKKLVYNNRAYSTEEGYGYSLNSLLKFNKGEVELSEIDFEMVRKWKLWMEKGRPVDDQKALARRTIKGYMICLRKVLAYMRKQGYECLDPDEIKLEKKLRDPPPHVIKPEEVAYLIKVAGDTPRCSKLIRTRNQAIISLLYSTGLRASELCNLNREDVTHQTFTVYGKLEVSGQCVIDSRSRDLLDKYLLLRDDYNPALFVDNMTGNRLTTGTLQAFFRRLSKRAKLKKAVHPHTLRHSFATDLMVNGCHIFMLMNIMRHRHITSTQVYLHTSDPALVADHMKYHTV